MTLVLDRGTLYAEPEASELDPPPARRVLPAFESVQPPREVHAPEHTLLDVPDLERAFEILNPNRFNPRTNGSNCAYAVRDESDGFPTYMPSCLVGSLFAVLVPDFFARIRGEHYYVGSLPGICQVFTKRAIQLLTRAQGYADGAGLTAPHCWGDAFANALAEL